MGSTYSTPTGKVVDIKKIKRGLVGISYKKNKVLKDEREIFLRDQAIFNSYIGNKKKRMKDKTRISKKYGLADFSNMVRFQCGVLLPIEVYKPENFD
jgi:hypothetical protein